jgi:hypothetical protein
MPASARHPAPAPSPRPAARPALLALLASLALIALAAACGGDREAELIEVHRLVTESRSDAIELPGQTVPATVDTTVLWLGPELARRDGADGTFLVDAARGELTHVDHPTRTWTTQTTAQIEQLLRDLAADTLGGGPRDPRLAQLQSVLNVAVRVSETDQEAELDGYRCRRWLVEQFLGDQHVTSELWLTRGIDLDYGLLHRAARPTLRALPGGAEALRELSRLQGVPVRSTSIMRLYGGRGRTETRLLAVEKVRLPRSFFRPPPDYRSSAGD